MLGDIPSLRGIWEGAALFVPPNDDKRLRDVLQRLISDPAELQAYGVRARSRALEFTPERMAAGYLSAYSELMMTYVPSSRTLILDSV